MEKTFNYYKNLIDRDTKEMKDYLFNLLDIIHYETLDELIISSKKDLSFNSIKNYYYDSTKNNYEFELDNYYFEFNYNKKEILIQDYESSLCYIKIDLKTKLLKEIRNEDIFISMEKDAFLKSKDLELDIENKILNISKELFDHVYIYEQQITIDNEIKSSFFITLKSLDAVLDLDCIILNDEIEIKRINVYLNNIDTIKEIENINKKRHCEKEELKKIFENKKCSELEKRLEQKFKKMGLSIINEDKIKKSFKLKYKK